MSDRDAHNTPRGGMPTPGRVPVLSLPDSDAAPLVDALRQLSTLLLLTAEATDNIVAALTGEAPYAEPVRTGQRTDNEPDIGPDTQRPTLALVRPVVEPSRTAPADVSTDTAPVYVRDVEPRENGHWRGRVRWLDQETKRYRSRSKNFDDSAAAWAWTERWALNATRTEQTSS